MSCNKKTRKSRKQKGGSLMTFILGAGVGGLLTSLFAGDSTSRKTNSSRFDSSSYSFGGGKRKTRVKRKNSKTKKNRK